MKQIIKQAEYLTDQRQEWKIRHKLSEIVMIVLLSMLANADEWEQIEDFAYANEEFLREHLTLENGIPSHDTIQRVMSIIEPKELQGVQLAWGELINSEEGEKPLDLLIFFNGAIGHSCVT